MTSFKVGMLRRRDQHTERKCVDEPKTHRHFTLELSELLGNIELSVVASLHLVSIRHFQNNLALESVKKCDKWILVYHRVRQKQYRTARCDPSTGPGSPGIWSRAHVLLLPAWDDTLPRNQVQGHDRATCVLGANTRRILTFVISTPIPCCTCKGWY